MCAPFTAERLITTGLKTYTVWGNVDGDPWGITKKGGENLVVPPAGQEFNEVILDDKKIAFTHYPDIARELAVAGYYDCVFYGHSHIAKKEVIGDCLLVNPGTVSGIVKGKAEAAFFVIYDTGKSKIEYIKI